MLDLYEMIISPAMTHADYNGSHSHYLVRKWDGESWETIFRGIEATEVLAVITAKKRIEEDIEEDINNHK